eukprot:5897368-Prymnesium_polylepis.1
MLRSLDTRNGPIAQSIEDDTNGPVHVSLRAFSGNVRTGRHDFVAHTAPIDGVRSAGIFAAEL